MTDKAVSWIIVALMGGFSTLLFAISAGFPVMLSAGAGTVVFGGVCAVGMMLTDGSSGERCWCGHPEKDHEVDGIVHLRRGD